MTHPTWATTTEQHDSGDVVHTGAFHLFAGRDGVLVMHRFQHDDYGPDGEQRAFQHEVRVERIDQPRPDRRSGDGYDPGAEHYTPDEVETLAALAEAQGDDEGRELAALLRELGRAG